jgi:putative glutamine transport system substrate-binding protein
MRLFWLRSLALLTLIALVTSACGGAPAAPGTTGGKGLPKAPEGTLLRKIQDRGKIIIGVKYDIPTFGYLNPKTNQLEGFDVEIGRAIAEYIFGDRNAVEFKEAISKNRIPYLQDGTVDVILSTMTINEERLQQIDFSVVYYVAGQSLLVPKNSPIKGLADLKGKKVGTVKGSTSEKNIRQKAPEAEVSLFDKYADAVAAMEAGQVDAVTTDDIILYGFVRQEPDKWQVVGGQFTKEPYGAGVAKGNPELLEVVNTVIKAMKADGRWKQIYQTWISKDNVPEPPPDDWRAAMQ